MYVTEIAWRLFYLTLAFGLTFIISLYYGEFRLAFSMEPWSNEWEMETRPYQHPSEIWNAYRKVSSLIALYLCYPLVGGQLIFFLFNGFTRKEQYHFLYYWILSCIFLFSVWIILINYQIMGALMDISHFDEDVEIVYVPNVSIYISNWTAFRISGIFVSQLPILWFYYNSYRFILINNNKYALFRKRVIFMWIFMVPTLLSAIRLFDDILLQLIWITILRCLYLIALYRSCLFQTYNDEALS